MSDCSLLCPPQPITQNQPEGWRTVPCKFCTNFINGTFSFFIELNYKPMQNVCANQWTQLILSDT